MAATDCVIRLARYFNTTTFVRRADIVRSAGPRGTRSFPCPFAPRPGPAAHAIGGDSAAAPVPRRRTRSALKRPSSERRPPPSAGAESDPPTFREPEQKTRESLVGPTGFFRPARTPGEKGVGRGVYGGPPKPLTRSLTGPLARYETARAG